MPGHRPSLGSRILLIVTRLVPFMLRLPEAGRCLQVIATYSVYAVGWTEVLPLRFFRIPGGRTVSRCFVQQTGHSYTLFRSGKYIHCNCILFYHAHTGRYCAGLPDRIRQRHTLMYPRHRHGKYACHIRVPAALHRSRYFFPRIFPLESRCSNTIQSTL